jgi:hypothetical protein
MATWSIWAGIGLTVLSMCVKFVKPEMLPNRIRYPIMGGLLVAAVACFAMAAHAGFSGSKAEDPKKINNESVGGGNVAAAHDADAASAAPSQPIVAPKPTSPRRRRSAIAPKEAQPEPPVHMEQNNSDHAQGFQMYKPEIHIGLTDASPENPPKLTVKTRHTDMSDGTKVMLIIESNVRLVRWRAAVKHSEESLLVDGRFGSTTDKLPGGIRIERPGGMEHMPFDADGGELQAEKIRVVGSDDPVAPGDAIFLSFKKLPSAVWVGSDKSFWPVDLSAVR